MIQLLIQGGVVMIPILGLSILALALIIERGVFYLRIREKTGDLTGLIIDMLSRRETARVKDELSTRTSPEAEVLKEGLRLHRKKADAIDRAMESKAMKWVDMLEKNIQYLSSIANLATLLGLMGTVTGMIMSFMHLKTSGVADPAVLAGGIAQALITTAAGLTVAIPSLFCYHLFHQLANRTISRMEIAASELLTFYSKAKS